jgi:hypothetical protein
MDKSMTEPEGGNFLTNAYNRMFGTSNKPDEPDEKDEKETPIVGGKRKSKGKKANGKRKTKRSKSKKAKTNKRCK